MANDAKPAAGKSGTEKVTMAQLKAEIKELQQHEGCSRREAMYRIKKRHPEARELFRTAIEKKLPTS